MRTELSQEVKVLKVKLFSSTHEDANYVAAELQKKFDSWAQEGGSKKIIVDASTAITPAGGEMFIVGILTVLWR